MKNSHWLRVLHYTGLVIIGGILSAVYFYKEVNVEMLYFASFSSFFAFQSALVVNNIYDKKKVDYPVNPYKNISIILASLAIVASLFINATFLLLTITYLLLGFVYSAPPIRFKRFGYWNNLLIGFESALMFAAGFVSQTPDIKLIPLNMFLTIFVIFSIAGNIKDLKDLEGDKKEGIKTLPVILGKKKSVRVLALLTSICFPLSAIMLGFWDLLLASVIFGIANAFLLMKFKTEKTVFACYFMFLLVLGYWLLFF
jgi:4-hydroxybenzoate polyprenyltransferase